MCELAKLDQHRGQDKEAVAFRVDRPGLSGKRQRGFALLPGQYKVLLEQREPSFDKVKVRNIHTPAGSEPCFEIPEYRRDGLVLTAIQPTPAVSDAHPELEDMRQPMFLCERKRARHNDVSFLMIGARVCSVNEVHRYPDCVYRENLALHQERTGDRACP